MANSNGAWTRQAYLKASNTGVGAQFGTAIAISADGNTVAVGAPGEKSLATGINGDQTNVAGDLCGAVCVFTRSLSGWTQQAYLKPSNTQVQFYFGAALSISADGNTLAIGAYGESSTGRGVNGEQNAIGQSYSAAVYMFSRSGDTCSQRAYLKASNPGGTNYFGLSVALSGEGQTMVAAAPYESNYSTGIDGDQMGMGDGLRLGAAYVFVRSADTWSQRPYVKASNTALHDYFGTALAIDGAPLGKEEYQAAVRAGEAAHDVRRVLPPVGEKEGPMCPRRRYCRDSKNASGPGGVRFRSR